VSGRIEIAASNAIGEHGKVFGITQGAAVHILVGKFATD
tara:strand:- start:273 stop:389 length:117 start_codon:yes stop_codon:yes gene_type:complete